MVLVFFLFLQSMRFEMKNIFLVVTILLIVNTGYSQCDGSIPPPPPQGLCECNLDFDPTTCTYVEGLSYQECVEANGCAVPINSNIFFLFASAISLGGYFFYKSHKKNLH